MCSLRTFIGAWLALGALIFFGLGSLNLSKFRAIAAESRVIDGTVISTNCANHANVSYRYEIGQQTYNGQTAFGDACYNLKAGDKITVYYAEQSPELSELGYPSKALQNELLAVGAASILMPPLMILGVLRGIKRGAS